MKSQKIKIVYRDEKGNHIDTKYTEYELQGHELIDKNMARALAKCIKPVLTWKIYNVTDKTDEKTNN